MFKTKIPFTGIITSASTLGNYSQPAESNVFIERDRNQEFILINPFYPYMKLFTNTRYVNTRKPFTQVGYFQGRQQPDQG